jgi:hypothetical protein
VLVKLLHVGGQWVQSLPETATAAEAAAAAAVGGAEVLPAVDSTCFTLQLAGTVRPAVCNITMELSVHDGGIMRQQPARTLLRSMAAIRSMMVVLFSVTHTFGKTQPVP